jgi:hypothetical protein
MLLDHIGFAVIVYTFPLMSMLIHTFNTLSFSKKSCMVLQVSFTILVIFYTLIMYQFLLILFIVTLYPIVM